MGRTARERRRKKNKLLTKFIVDDMAILRTMEKWMLALDWFPVCDLVPSIFPVTGRGLKCLANIRANDIIVKIPRNMLITTSTLRDSGILKIFKNTQSYKAQCVLAVFLSYEKHLRENSKWKPYLDSLPRSYTNPDFCSFGEKRYLSPILKDLEIQSREVQRNFYAIAKSIDALKKIEKHLCPHCEEPLDKILTFGLFKWAYYTVNTRAVYINSTSNVNQVIRIKDIDNLALAPFLDLFNHSYDAAVDVGIFSDSDDNEYYQIKTLKAFSEGSQVFINYGPHNNEKLFLEYGFFIPNNPLDQVSFKIFHIKQCQKVSQCLDDFIVSHCFHENMGFTSEGLSYNAKIVLFILTTKSTADYWKVKVFNGEFSTQDILEINSLGRKILEIRMIELVDQFNKMKKVVQSTESFKIATSLLEEYINLLNKSLQQLNANNSC